MENVMQNGLIMKSPGLKVAKAKMHVMSKKINKQECFCFFCNDSDPLKHLPWIPNAAKAWIVLIAAVTKKVRKKLEELKQQLRVEIEETQKVEEMFKRASSFVQSPC